MTKTVGTRIRIESADVPKASAPEDGADADVDADVVVEQFTREFTAILQLTREKQSKELTSESFGGSPEDVINARQEVAFYGDIAQKLTPLMDRLMQATNDQINAAKKTELLLAFGDKFYNIQEFRAASMFFYEKVLVLDEMSGKAPEEVAVSEPQDILKRTLASTSSSTVKRSRIEGQAYVRSLFGVAMSCFHVQKRCDGFVKHPGRLEKMIEALTFLRLGMETAVAMERQYSGQFTWLTLNGSVFIYSIAKPLQALGFSREVLAYLKWSLLAMESAVALSTTKYIMWRLQLGSAICDCYEDLAFKETMRSDQHLKSAVACAAYLQQIAQRLRKEEELDMPLPAEVQRVLTQAETTSAMLATRVKAAAGRQPVTRSSIEAAFPEVPDQMRAAIDALESLSREVKQKCGGEGTFVLIPSTTPPPTNETMFELLAFVMEIVTPMLKPLIEEEEEELTSQFALDNAIFPVSFHLSTIRHSFLLGKAGDEMLLLIKSAHARLNSSSEGLLERDAPIISCLLELFETLHEIKASWLSWESLSEDERLEVKLKPRQQLPVSGGELPASKFLLRLSKAMQGCVFHGDGSISRTNAELLTFVALQMWREFAVPMLKELDATEPPQMSRPFVRLTCELLLTIHFTFTAVKFEDLLLHGRVCLRLATLLSIRGKARRGSQVVRQCLERINSRRSELVNFHSHFHSVVDRQSDPGITTPISKYSFTCTIGDSSPLSEGENPRDRVSVRGTGSQFGGVHQDMCCVQVDLTLLLYRLELQAASMVDVLPLTNSKPSIVTPGISLQANSVLLTAELKLLEECDQNGYARVLLNIQRLVHPQKSVKERLVIADESIQLLQQVELQEENLCRQLASMKAEVTESTVPLAPIVISRSSSAITLQIVEYRPSLQSLRKRRVEYYMVFAKATGVGTAVSLNSNHLTGTATPVYPPHLDVTISGLLPNESYVFAVAAYDSKHEVINSIGETSEPVVALNPLPLPMCYGYLAKACYDTQLAARANKAAHYLYNAVVSHACAGRPSWMANPFYRQALKRDVVAQFPVPILNLCIQALLILCHNEPGDLERDGKLVTTSDLDAQSLTTTQTKALEDSRKISMAIEIACATDNIEAIRVLCFKGYRLLLPLLHLKGSCDGLTFAALVTFYQALHVIPSEKWDDDTRNIRARIGFELFRIAQEAHSDISRVTIPLIVQNHEQVHSGNNSEEHDSLREVVALFKLATNSQGSQEVSTPAPPTTAAATPRGAKGAPAAAAKDKSQSNTPQATPRSGSETEKGEAGAMQSLSELLHAAGNDLLKVFAILERHSSSDRRTIEFASKVCGSVLGSGANDVSQMDKFLASLKVAGEISNQFRATLQSLGGGELLPQPKNVVVPDEANPLSSRPDEENKTSEIPETEATVADAVAGADDEYLYRWCGELFYIQAVLLFRKIVKLCNTVEEVDTANGPGTEDCTYALLHPENNKEDDTKGANETKNALEADADQENVPAEDQDATVPQAEPSDTPEANQVDQLFGELLEKTAGCCKLFRLANCWQGLQAAAQQLWNAIWLAWIAPSRIGTSPTRLGHLSTCVDALLDMMDIAMNGSQDQSTALQTAPAPASAEQSMALSTVVYAATSALNVDQTWFAQLMAFSLRVFCSFKDWNSIVQTGSRYHALCGSSTEGSRFSEQNFPVLIYAQQQILNHQETLLKAAQEELNAYVTAFQEQEAKKKKKKSRLVVEEVLSPEEIAFRAKKQVLEQRIQELVADRDLERAKLAELSESFDELSNAINKSHQALNTCHELVERYRRLDQRTRTDDINAHRYQDELLALRRQIVAAYNRCVILSRQKRQKRIVCQALQEAGDFHLASGDVKSATKSWLESLDNAFSTLNVGMSWREVLTPPADQFLESANKDKISGDELWVGMQCCSALSKLIMLSSGDKLHKAVDYALMAATIFTRFYGCSLPHPTKCFLFGSYQMLGPFWPGRKLLTDADRVSPFTLCIMMVLVPEVLLQYQHQYATTAMPVITGYEYVAEYCLDDTNHVANACRFRLEALIQCGRFQEAFQAAMKLLRGGSTPRSSSGIPESDPVVFHDSKSILDESNRAAVNWLVSLNAEQTQSELTKFYPDELVGHILVAILHLAVALARHESRYDRDAAIARSAAKKLAQAMLLIVKPSEASTPPAQTSSDAVDGEATGGVATEPQSVSWELLQIHRIRADIHLQLSYLAFYEGEWSTSRSSAMDAISEYNAIPTVPEHHLRLELDQKLKYSLVLGQGTFVAKCRAQAVTCLLAQTHYHAAFEAAETAIEEAKSAGEEHLRQHLESLRLQAEVFLGEREKTERELCVLREEALASHTSVSLTYISTLQALSSLLRSKALLLSQTLALNAVNEHLSEAEHVLDALLEHDGWIGVSADHQHAEKRLNIYRPGIPEFVQIHADLAQVLLECPLDSGSENVQTRQERALQSVESGIRALDHTTQRMSSTKARLLLLKGVILSKKLYGTVSQIHVDSPVQGEQNLEQRFTECVEAFTGSIKSSIEGGYDRQLVRLALIELINLLGQKLVPGSEDAHVQAAFHYLNLAVEVQQHEAVLFDTLELQNGSVTSVEKLPPSVLASINAQSEAAKEDVPAPPPTNNKAPDVAAIVNYFVRLQRMQHILPVNTAAIQDTSALLHSFLGQYHSTYSRMACLTDIPPVPSSDPEICAGMVCALWGQDLAPALASEAGETAHNNTITFYFTLGTTKVSIVEDSPAASNTDAIARMEKFASSPLLSKRGNVDRQAIQHLKAALSKLRTQMEDEDSLLIDRNTFSKMLHLILSEIQQLFRGAEHPSSEGSQDNVSDAFVAGDASSQSLQDAFGNSISVDCTLDTVHRLEDLFSINKGANIADNELCYFLRDLLD